MHELARKLEGLLELQKVELLVKQLELMMAELLEQTMEQTMEEKLEQRLEELMGCWLAWQ